MRLEFEPLHPLTLCKSQKVVDHTCLGPSPLPPEERDADPLAERIHIITVGNHSGRIVAGKIVARIVQKIDMFVGIGQIMETHKRRLNHLQGFLERGDDDRHGGIFDQGGQRRLLCRERTPSHHYMEDLEKISHAVEKDESLGQKKKQRDRLLVPEIIHGEKNPDSECQVGNGDPHGDHRQYGQHRETG